MKYYSTNGKSEPVSFSEALLKGLAPDGGLFMPERIPQISQERIDSFSTMPYHQIATEICKEFIGDQIDGQTLSAMTKEAYNFDIPLELLCDRKYIMRLDRGPTASFKDFAGRMMARLMNYFLQKEKRNLLILTATSGDTGSAIANAFYGLENIKVVVLFPQTEVTTRQRLQMTTLGKNICIVAIRGKFDDCQALAKRAFSDPELVTFNLSSANSINIGRLVPQIVYYFYAYSRLRSGNSREKVLFSVPTGNFGDCMAGIMGKAMGLPVEKFIIATNGNDSIVRFLESGEYKKISPSINCISSAMNVGHPSNFARAIHLYGGQMDEQGKILKDPDIQAMRADLYGCSISDADAKSTISQLYKDYGALLEPHGAVGWTGLMRYASKNGLDPKQLCICLETAHPAKFPEQIRETLGFDPDLPESLKGLEGKEEFYVAMENDYSSVKRFIKKQYL